MPQEPEAWLANALFFGAKLELKMFECYDELVERLPKPELKKQAAAIRTQEVEHLVLSGEVVRGVVANPFLAKQPVCFEEGKELEELVGKDYAEILVSPSGSVSELLGYCFKVESFYETAYAKL
ncbi:MAG: hypothetical protein AB1626_01000, partial [Candidatus Micrarchaeota archaeon]